MFATDPLDTVLKAASIDADMSVPGVTERLEVVRIVPADDMSIIRTVRWWYSGYTHVSIFKCNSKLLTEEILCSYDETYKLQRLSAAQEWTSREHIMDEVPDKDIPDAVQDRENEKLLPDNIHRLIIWDVENSEVHVVTVLRYPPSCNALIDVLNSAAWLRMMGLFMFMPCWSIPQYPSHIYQRKWGMNVCD